MTLFVHAAEMDAAQLACFQVPFGRDVVGGAAVLGRRVGDVVEIVIPAGRRKIRIVRLPYQPEQAGEFDL